jgi:hypothetical protein
MPRDRAAANGRLAANLTLAAENLADHLTHFYLFFMPDFARADYKSRRLAHGAVERFRATVSGSAPNEVLPARARFMQMMGLLAGKWPHTLAVQPGGSTRPLQSSEIFRLHRILREFRRFLERTTFGCRLEEVAALSSRNELSAWQQQAGGGDLRHFLHIADDLDLWHLGRGSDRFISYGCYPEGGAPVSRRVLGSTIPAARYRPGSVKTFPMPGMWPPVCRNIRRTAALCRWPIRTGSLFMVQGAAPGRSGGRNRRPGATNGRRPSAAARHGAGRGGSVAARVVARLLELALVLPAMERWLDEITPGEPWCIAGPLADESRGAGLIEAARGSLGHWLSVKPWPHPQLPDHRPDHLEFFTARRARPTGRPGASPRRFAGDRRPGAPGRDSSCGPQF